METEARSQKKSYLLLRKYQTKNLKLKMKNHNSKSRNFFFDFKFLFCVFDFTFYALILFAQDLFNWPIGKLKQR